MKSLLYDVYLSNSDEACDALDYAFTADLKWTARLLGLGREAKIRLGATATRETPYKLCFKCRPVLGFNYAQVYLSTVAR